MNMSMNQRVLALHSSGVKNLTLTEEDTFALLDALELDADLLKALDPAVVLEIGSGSGCVSAFVAKILGNGSLYLCSDINDTASRCTGITGEKNKVLLNPVITSLVDGFLPRLQGNISLLIFNPPYVPTDQTEAVAAQVDRDIAGAWAGGMNGMDVTEKLLSIIPDLLSENGLFYLVTVRENDPAGIARRAETNLGISCKIVLQRRAGMEQLFILRFRRQTE